jgi:flagellar hook-associated protein 2
MATSVTPPTFSGQSSFASSLQAALTRAVSIASLPMQSLQADATALQSQQTSLNSLESTFTSLQNSLSSLNSAAQGAPTATSSDSTTVTATASASALPGSYSITVDRIGSPATAVSNLGSTAITNPTTQNIGASNTFRLSIDGTSYPPITAPPITLTSNNLQALALAINNSGAPVQATIVNLSGSSLDYRLALTSTSFSAQNIQLSDGTNNLLGHQVGGITTQYRVPGSTGEIDASSDQVTLAPGLTVNLLDTTASAATINVSTSYAQVSSALSAFATSYNAAANALSAQIGPNAGVLGGESLIYQLSSMLSGLSQYTGGSGSVNSFTDLGLNLDETGHLNFDASKLSGATMSDVLQFLGSTSSGGFLQAANNALTSMTDSSTGTIHVSFTALQNQVDYDNSHISDEQSRINDLQTSLMQKLTAADAAIAQLESQKSYFLQLFQAQYPSSSSGG